MILLFVELFEYGQILTAHEILKLKILTDLKIDFKNIALLAFTFGLKVQFEKKQMKYRFLV